MLLCYITLVRSLSWFPGKPLACKAPSADGDSAPFSLQAVVALARSSVTTDSYVLLLVLQAVLLTLQHSARPITALTRVWAVFLLYAAGFLFAQYAYQFDEVRKLYSSPTHIHARHVGACEGSRLPPRAPAGPGLLLPARCSRG